MAKPAELEKLTGLASRFGAFVAERYPFALADALDAFEKATGGRELTDETAIEAARTGLQRELNKRLQSRTLPEGLPDTTPRTTAAARMGQAHAELLDAVDGFLRRAAIAASLTPEERLEILRGIILKGVGLLELWVQTLALCGFAVAVVSIATIRVHKQLD